MPDTKILSFRFNYDGEIRHVDNVTFEPDHSTFVGLEVRKSGKFSWKIKRYKVNKTQNMVDIPPHFSEDYYVQHFG